MSAQIIDISDVPSDIESFMRSNPDLLVGSEDSSDLVICYEPVKNVFYVGSMGNFITWVYSDVQSANEHMITGVVQSGAIRL